MNFITDNIEKSDTSKNIKSDIVKQFSDSNNSWLKSKNSIIPEKGMYLIFCEKLFYWTFCL